MSLWVGVSRYREMKQQPQQALEEHSLDELPLREGESQSPHIETPPLATRGVAKAMANINS